MTQMADAGHADLAVGVARTRNPHVTVRVTG